LYCWEFDREGTPKIEDGRSGAGTPEAGTKYILHTASLGSLLCPCAPPCTQSEAARSPGCPLLFAAGAGCTG